MGLNNAFELRLTDLSGLSIPGHPYVTITDIFQKSTIEVLEWGIAASSSISCKFTCYSRENLHCCHRVIHKEKTCALILFIAYYIIIFESGFIFVCQFGRITSINVWWQ